QWTTDAFYFLATHLPAQLLTFLMVLPALLLTKWLAIPPLQAFVQSWPYLVQLVAAIFVADLGQYLVHRTFHTVPFLWRFHSIHHSIKTLDWIAGSRSHFIDIVITRGLVMIPMMVCGFPQSVLAGYLVFVSFHATFCHTDFRPDAHWLERYLVTVRYHHWHHAADKEAVNVNFAIHFPFLDRLFGTHHLPKAAWPERYGKLDGDGFWKTMYLCLFPYPCQDDYAEDDILKSAPFRMVAHPVYAAFSQLASFGVIWVVFRDWKYALVLWGGLRIFALWVNLIQNYWTHNRRFGTRRYDDADDNAMNIGDWLPVMATFSGCLQNNHTRYTHLLGLGHAASV